MTWANNYACTHAENKNFSRKTWHTPVSSNLSKYIWRVRFKALALVLYMSFDRFLLAVESCDLSQADKSIIHYEKKFTKLMSFGIN